MPDTTIPPELVSVHVPSALIVRRAGASSVPAAVAMSGPVSHTLHVPDNAVGSPTGVRAAPLGEVAQPVTTAATIMT